MAPSDICCTRWKPHDSPAVLGIQSSLGWTINSDVTSRHRYVITISCPSLTSLPSTSTRAFNKPCLATLKARAQQLLLTLRLLPLNHSICPRLQIANTPDCTPERPVSSFLKKIRMIAPFSEDRLARQSRVGSAAKDWAM